jgi:hypothetical protein
MTPNKVTTSNIEHRTARFLNNMAFHFQMKENVTQQVLPNLHLPDHTDNLIFQTSPCLYNMLFQQFSNQLLTKQ